MQRLEDAGIGAVVMPSLFEEQLRLEADAAGLCEPCATALRSANRHTRPAAIQ